LHPSAGGWAYATPDQRQRDLKSFTQDTLSGSVGRNMVSRQTEPSSTYVADRRPPTTGRVLTALVVPCLVYIFLQFVGLVLHLTGAARRLDWLGTLASVCSLVAWFVLLVGLVRLVIKLRAWAATRAGRRGQRASS
jgi:hypothetical protein